MIDFKSQQNKTKTSPRAALSDPYLRARDLEVRQLADKVLHIAGRSASSEFLSEVATAVIEAARKREAR